MDYDRLALEYGERFRKGSPGGVGRALRALVDRERPVRTLEVGCGTGYWLRHLEAGLRGATGIDPSMGMLQAGRRAGTVLPMVRAPGEALPFAGGVFDLVFSVNVAHHMDDFPASVAESARVLRPGGVLAVIGMRPPGPGDGWYLYDYFDGARERDRARYPLEEAVGARMGEAGFVEIAVAEVERIERRWVGAEVLEDPALGRTATSQMMLLGDSAYEDGMREIRSRIGAAPEDAPPTFETRITMVMVAGRQPV